MHVFWGCITRALCLLIDAQCNAQMCTVHPWLRDTHSSQCCAPKSTVSDGPRALYLEIRFGA